MARTYTKPTRVRDEQERKEGIPLNGHMASPRFVYVHYPAGWEYSATGKEFLPVLSSIKAVPGVNQVGKDQHLGRAIGSAMEKGGRVINPSDGRLGDFIDYVGYYETEGGGRYHVDFCQEAEVLDDGRVIWTQDSEAWLAFRRHLRDSGILQPMARGIYLMLDKRMRQRVQMQRKRMGANPHLAGLAEQKAREVDEMAEAWAAYSASAVTPAEATPPRKRAPQKRPDRRPLEEPEVEA